MLRRFTRMALAVLWLASVVSTSAMAVRAGEQKDEKQKAEQKKDEQRKDDKTPTAEQVAETVVLVYGQRQLLAQIRHSGIERGRVTRTTDDGRTEVTTYELSFKRGATSDKDKMRLDQKRAALEYSLIYNEGQVYGLVRGTSFTPRREDVADFLTEAYHGIETLLRYKENGANVTYVGKDKQKNIDMWILDLADKENRRTRYYISSQTGRILWLEYDETPPGGSSPVKYRRTFHDYRIVQGTRVPYVSRLYENDRQVEETQILTVTYGIKMDDTIFQNPEAASGER